MAHPAPLAAALRGRGLRARWAKRPGKRRKEGDGASHWWDWLDLPVLDDGLAGIAIGIAAIVLLVLLVLWGLPLLLALFDLIVVLLVLVVSVVGRVVFRRPWTIESTSEGERRTRQVVGWFASRRAAAAWADEVRHGQA